MTKIRIAGAQVPVSEDISANRETLLRAIREAQARGAEILLTPEGSLSGYTHRFDRAAAEGALTEVVRRAAEAGLALALGTCRVEEDGRCYNQLRFYDRAGRFLGYHAKILRTGTLTTPPRGEIEHYATRELGTVELDGVRVGGLICNDLWANPECTPDPDPHLTHQLGLAGARIIFHAVNGGRDASPMSQVVVKAFHESNLRMRARADGLYIATVDNAFPTDIGVSAPGGLVGPDGEWITRAPDRGTEMWVGSVEIR